MGEVYVGGRMYVYKIHIKQSWMPMCASLCFVASSKTMSLEGKRQM